MKHPIAMIPYANMAPYREMGSPRGCCFVDCVPRESIQALKDRCVWAAAVPVGGLSELEGQIRFLGRFGIAVRRQAMSVLFFSDRAFQTFNRHHTISLTGESASSVRLLYLLMGYRLGFDALPSVVPKGNPSNGCLVIGDRALRWAGAFERSGAVRGYGYVTDLGQRWYQQFQLPFVFARWVVHRDAPDAVRHSLMDWLERFREKEAACIHDAAPKVATRLGVEQAYAERYLKVIKRCLSRDDDIGQERFISEIRRYGAVSLFPPALTEMRRTA
jgi:chorismate dehydratase